MFEINFTGGVVLKTDEIWPDGDAPESPTALDVLRCIQDSTNSVSDLLQNWNLEDCILLSVRDTDTGTVEHL